ncbi:Retrovirus-related Pol polyprotein from transposon 17.6 [Gossypium australe]|uniref:Retrovirus-related Pol polyprotein from transposon 17.6 n=1 Tax=Gossypium australe TaxID=47621 RepID=A0A5B6VZ72_9ROSI|nr:Retrovirus-related Pol polyprotein from transposon 17.6 [Gossypium australe]
MANRVYIYTNHSMLKYVMKKKEMNARLMRWVLDRKETKNQVADHLSRLKMDAEEKVSIEINEKFMDKQLFQVEKCWVMQSTHSTPWYVDIVNYLSQGVFPADAHGQGKRKLCMMPRNICGKNHMYSNNVQIN